MEHKENFFWGLIDEDCPKIVIDWLLKCYNVSVEKEINKSSGAKSMETFINPFGSFNTPIGDIYEWTIRELEKSSINPRIKITDTGPTDLNRYTYSPPMLYFIGRRKGVEFNREISNVFLLHHVLLIFKSSTERERKTTFDPNLKLENYDRCELESFSEELGYSKTKVKNSNPKILYDLLSKIYNDYYFKYEGCICMYCKNDEPFCYTENDMLIFFKNKMINPITGDELNEDQILQLLFMSKRYKLRKLFDKIIELISSKKYKKLYYVEYSMSFSNLSKANLYIEVLKCYEFLNLMTYPYEILNKLTECSDKLKKIPLCINDIISDKTINDAIREISKGNTEILIHVRETLKLYLESHKYA